MAYREEPIGAVETSDLVTFSSAFFQVEPGEDAQTNPGIFGKALAHWLAEQLRRRGVPVLDVVAEDWGWCVTVKTQPLRLGVACASFDGSTTRWRAFVFAERGPLQWVRRSGDPRAEVAELRSHLAAVIAAVPDATDVEWEAD